MIKASALYMSVIVSLVIVLICGAILMASSLIGRQYQVHRRAFRLADNLDSGIQLVLSSGFATDRSMSLSLYDNAVDSLLLLKSNWGIYELAKIKTWIGKDSIEKTFLMAAKPEDSTKVFFLADEDRPMSISGASLIKGTAYLPKAGIKAAYVNGAAYNEQELVLGVVKDSQRNLPELSLEKLQYLKDLIDGGQQVPLGMVFFRDSMITINSDFKGTNALLIARYIKIADDFSGQLQAIATDSIVVGNRVKLNYPSALVLLKNDTAQFQTQLKIGSDCNVSGQLISYEQSRSEQMPVISIGEKSKITGEIWSKGYVNLSKGSSVAGSVSAIRLMARVDGGLYENYLIDVKLDVSARSRYYLSSPLINTKPAYSKILCWIN